MTERNFDREERAEHLNGVAGHPWDWPANTAWDEPAGFGDES